MCNLINTHTQVSLIPPWEDQCEWHRMTRMTRPDCAVMCNLINTHTHTHTHTQAETDARGEAWNDWYDRAIHKKHTQHKHANTKCAPLSSRQYVRRYMGANRTVTVFCAHSIILLIAVLYSLSLLVHTATDTVYRAPPAELLYSMLVSTIELYTVYSLSMIVLNEIKLGYEVSCII